MRQIIYASVARDAKDLHGILEQSRHNNALDGITGLLWSDGRRYVQVLEGPEESVGPTFDRIGRDPRHHSIEVLTDRRVDGREFGYWSMAHRGRGDGPDDLDRRTRARLDRVSPDLRRFLDGLIAGADRG